MILIDSLQSSLKYFVFNCTHQKLDVDCHSKILV